MFDKNIDKNTDFAPQSTQGVGARPGPYLAKVVSYLDPTYMGILEVELLRPVGNQSNSPGQLHQVKMMSPFYGCTSVDYVGNQDVYNETQKAYGMWFIPPDVGTTVMVIFIDGDPKRGYWIGCVPDEAMNFMIPGIAATSYVSDGKNRLPVAEYNKKVNDKPTNDTTKIKKPKHPLVDIFSTQGLVNDDIRGITTSSSRREVPSMVFGVSTPGPVDKRQGAKTGKVGKAGSTAENVFVSRLGGTTFVMDDGDDKFLRKTTAGGDKAGPPDYASVAQGESGGNVAIPHNELVRIRTRTGHQILLHNSEDLIYIGNSRGTAWIELTSNGKIDIYSSDSISIHSANDINLRADRDLNFEAARNINMSAGVECQIQTVKDLNLIAGQNGKISVKQRLDVNSELNSIFMTSKTDFNISTPQNINATASTDINLKAAGNNKFTASGSTNIKSGGNHLETAAEIHMNGPGAASAATAVAAVKGMPLKDHLLPIQIKDKTLTSIMMRVPTHEPYPQHENLDPAAFIPKTTDRDVDGRYKSKDDEKPTESMKKPAEWWTKANGSDTPQYTTKVDPFSRVKRAQQ